MIVNPPKPAELRFLAEMGRDMWEESVFKVTQDYDISSVIEFGVTVLTEFLSGGDYFVNVARETNGTAPVGMIVGQVVPYFFCPNRRNAVDHIVYVSPNYRGTSAAHRLLKEFEKWAKDKGAIEMSIGTSTGVHPEKTHDFYVKMGYTHTGGIFKKPLV